MNALVAALAVDSWLNQFPPLIDAYRWPPEAYCNHQYAWAAWHLRWLEEQLVVPAYQTKLYMDWYKEALRRKEIWGAVSHLNATGYSPEYRWCEMRRLYELIGREAYYNGYLPSCMPTEYFSRIK